MLESILSHAGCRKISQANHNHSYAHQAQQQPRAPPALSSPASRTRNRRTDRTQQEVTQPTGGRSPYPCNKGTPTLNYSQPKLNKDVLMSLSRLTDLLHPLDCKRREIKKEFHVRRARPAILVPWKDPSPPQASQEVAH